MIKYIFLILLLQTPLNLSAGENNSNSTMKVLFIGNSLTYYNDVPSLVSALYNASNKNKTMDVEMIAEGGYSLEQHLKHPLISKTLNITQYDFVVIQDFGGWPLCSSKIPACSATSESLVLLKKMIESSGAIPIWFSTYQQNPKVQSALSNQSQSIANKLKIKMVDTGADLHRYLEKHKDEKVFTQDGHPSIIGSWIIALSIVQSISNKGVDKDMSLKDICTYGWIKVNLKADKLASTQKPKSQTCKNMSNEQLGKILNTFKR